MYQVTVYAADVVEFAQRWGRARGLTLNVERTCAVLGHHITQHLAKRGYCAEVTVLPTEGITSAVGGPATRDVEGQSDWAPIWFREFPDGRLVVAHYDTDR